MYFYDEWEKKKHKEICLVTVTRPLEFDPVLVETFKHIFFVANEEGLNGKKLRNFRISRNEGEDPIDNMKTYFLCDLIEKDEVEEKK